MMEVQSRLFRSYLYGAHTLSMLFFIAAGLVLYGVAITACVIEA